MLKLRLCAEKKRLKNDFFVREVVRVVRASVTQTGQRAKLGVSPLSRGLVVEGRLRAHWVPICCGFPLLFAHSSLSSAFLACWKRVFD